MIYNNRNMKLKITLYLIGLLFVSCTSNENIFQSPAQVAVTISVTLPEPEDVQTRAYTDKDIKNLTVLLFDNANKFMERIDVDASDLTVTGTGVKFGIILDATAENRTLQLIANARTDDAFLTDRIDFSGLNTTQTEANIVPALVTKAITTTGDNALLNGIGPLIMWGRIALNGVSITTTVDEVKLLRSVACVRVKKAASGTGLASLTLSRLAVHNGAGQGYVAPAAYNLAVTTTPTTGNPYAVATYDYTKAWSETSSTEPFAYIYERNCTTSDYMSVILSATYNGQAGYYKIALADGNTAPVNILRNHRYTITILSVNGPGYASVATAASSAPANNDLLKVQISVDDTETYPFIVADSQYWMGLSSNVFQLIGSSSGATTANVELCTVYSSRGIAPTVTNQPTGLTTSVTGSGNQYKVIGTFTNGTAITGQSLTIRCDNLSLPLEVQWTNAITSYAGGASDADSYVLNLANGLSSWKVWIPNPATSMVYLHPTASLPLALTANAGTGMLAELSVDYYSHAYLHINKSAGRKDEIWTSAYSNNTIIVRKTVIAQ